MKVVPGAERHDTRAEHARAKQTDTRRETERKAQSGGGREDEHASHFPTNTQTYTKDGKRVRSSVRASLDNVRTRLAYL